ncbi:stage II sporulation protein M [Zongyangia hominis]|uniref:Stage II sporulation protein M n=1 Tax=Zongyangia hominis TaxID=2763677 RepID=A0A926IBL2_9FIRM|nr:stage II sporulation protein M [Zongyangia hominis]MBC8570210.1 stage II sporulation protein M [Zongyangia hominis]
MSVSSGHSLGPAQFFRKELSKIFWFCLIGFLLCFFAVFLVFYFQPELSQNLMNELSEMFASKNIYTSTGGISFLSLFFNNARASLLMTAVGLLPFLFLPGWILAFNAAIVGIAAGASLNIGLSPASLTMGLLPHGIFEIPALCLAAALGIYLCKELVKKLIGRSELSSFGGVFLSILRFFLCVVLPLLLVAALMEAFVTPLLMELTL